jgi:mannitol-1-phosphate 5-dehydrogenase
MADSVVIFGAGKIGRSFLGLLFSRGGMRVTFVDAVPQVVEQLQSAREYRVIQLAPDGSSRTERVSDISCVVAGDREAVRTAVADASIICTAVGMRAFATVSEQIAQSLEDAPPRPRNLILAENIHGAGATAREIVARHGVTVAPAPGGLGIIETSIGKMVPSASPPGLVLESPLDVTAEPYSTLIVDRTGWAGTFPDMSGLLGVTNIRAYVDRKLFIHNFGHAATVYLGVQADPACRYVADALDAPGVLEQVRTVMMTSAAALAAEYPGDLDEADLADHVEDLIERFGNPYLYDTVIRVGQDLQRKLGADDRIVGAMKLMARHNADLGGAARVYLAALQFAPRPGPGEEVPEADRTLTTEYERRGLRWALARYSELGGNAEGPAARVRDAILRAGLGVNACYNEAENP